MESWTTEIKVQNTDAWLTWRKAGIGSSDVAAIMGVSPYSDAYKLWEEKTGKREPKDLSNNYIVQRGHEFEEVAREKVNDMMNRNYEARNFIHEEYEFMRVSLDGWDEDTQSVLEIKTPGTQARYAKLKQGGVFQEKHWMMQIQYQMFVSGAKYGNFCIISADDSDISIFHIQRDEQLIEEIVLAVKRFWNHVQDNTPPTVGDDFDLLAEKYTRLQSLVSRYNDELDEVKNKIKTMFKSMDVDKFERSGVRVTKYTSKGRVNYSKVPELKGVDLDKYRGKDIVSVRIEGLG